MSATFAERQQVSAVVVFNAPDRRRHFGSLFNHIKPWQAYPMLPLYPTG